MSCEQTAALLTEYLDNGLPVRRREQLDAHLQSCLCCREELESLREVNAQLLQWRDRDVPQWGRVPQLDRKPLLQWRWWPWAPLATAMTLVLAVLINGQLTGIDDPASEQVQRPDIDAMRQSMALALGDGEQLAPSQKDLLAFEQALFDVMCEHSAALQVLPVEPVIITFSLSEEAAGQGGDRIHVIDKTDIQGCLRGDIDAAQLRERSLRDSR